MLNSKLPDMSELPTTRQLVGSTLLAMGGAAAILVAVVMPSEYGIDPTGLGGVLGLTEMGEIKKQPPTGPPMTGRSLAQPNQPRSSPKQPLPLATTR